MSKYATMRLLVYWAKAHAFPYWPARICSTAEVETLSSQQAEKPGCIAVVFLGSKQEMSWIPTTYIDPFDRMTFDRFVNIVLCCVRLCYVNLLYVLNMMRP